MWWTPSALGQWSDIDHLNNPVSPATLLVMRKISDMTGIRWIPNIGMVC